MFGLVGLAVFEEPFEGSSVMAINESEKWRCFGLGQLVGNVPATVNGKAARKLIEPIRVEVGVTVGAVVHG
ncbi:MAG: hypothetical protein H7Y37_19800 [Anaerolineae bacterium]|nr:hypothetical protein [Gloeobacterales cyanobacterium ES-bin-313]